jgi:hypothetical protein
MADPGHGAALATGLVDVFDAGADPDYGILAIRKLDDPGSRFTGGYF